MDNTDKFISEIVSKKIKEPLTYEDTIKNALNYKRNSLKIKELIRKIAIIIVSIFTVGGIAFAVQLSGILKDEKNEENNYEYNEYIQQLDMDYQTIDNLSIKVNSILVDDFNIQIEMDYLYNEPITSAESKILVKDEKNNILYKNDVVIDYYKDNIFKKADRNDFINNRSINEGIVSNTVKEESNNIDEFTARYSSNYLNIENNNIKRTIRLYSNFNTKNFPKSKKIYIQLQDFVLNNGKNKVKEIKGKMIFEINLEEKYTNDRKIDTYQEKNIESNHNEFSITRAELSNTQLLLEIKYSGTQDISSLKLDSIQIWNERDEEYINAVGLEVLEDNIIFVNYDVNSKIFSDTIKVKIDYKEFLLQKSK